MSRQRLLAPAIAALSLLVPSSAAAQAEIVEYDGVDALGSVRVVFDSAGNLVNRMDYGPFGEQLAPSTFGRRVYAQLFRDGETGQDYAEARMYQTRNGRLTAPDSVTPNPSTPQGWNRYAYALNSPLLFVDPSGLQAEGPKTGCSAENSYSDCGGDARFWGTASTDFGDEYAAVVRMGWEPGMPSHFWESLKDYYQGTIEATLAGALERADTYDFEGTYAQGLVGLLSRAGQTVRNLTPAAQRSLNTMLRLLGQSGPFDRARQALMNAEPMGSALKGDAVHNAATFMRHSSALFGRYFNIQGADGQMRTLIQNAGDLNGISGRYEYIIDASGKLVHQMFVARGALNGIPIKP